MDFAAWFCRIKENIMTEMYPVALYFVQVAGKPGWTPGLLHVEPEKAAAAIAELHPEMERMRIVVQGMRSRKYDLNAPDDKYREVDSALGKGWWYDTRQHCWLAPEDAALVPVEKPLPAVMSLDAEEPYNGWWLWHLAFVPLVSNDAAIWTHLFGKGNVEYDIEFSGALERDPVDDMAAFIGALRKGAEARLVVDEEGGFTGMLAWHVDAERLHLRLMSLCRPQDKKYDFLVGKDAFIETVEKARRTFLAQGGWGEQAQGKLVNH